MTPACFKGTQFRLDKRDEIYSTDQLVIGCILPRLKPDLGRILGPGINSDGVVSPPVKTRKRNIASARS